MKGQAVIYSSQARELCAGTSWYQERLPWLEAQCLSSTTKSSQCTSVSVPARCPRHTAVLGHSEIKTTRVSRKSLALVSWPEAQVGVSLLCLCKGVRVGYIEVEGLGRALPASPTSAENANEEEDTFVKESTEQSLVRSGSFLSPALSAVPMNRWGNRAGRNGRLLWKPRCIVSERSVDHQRRCTPWMLSEVKECEQLLR